MPIVRPITDLQRNMKDVSDLIDERHEPVYLTRNGRAAYVLVDAETYDATMALHDEVREREIRINRSIQRGLQDFDEGRVTPLDEALEQADFIRRRSGL